MSKKGEQDKIVKILEKVPIEELEMIINKAVFHQFNILENRLYKGLSQNLIKIIEKLDQINVDNEGDK